MRNEGPVLSERSESTDPLALSERSESNGIDALIDEAARGLVAGEPSSALRGAIRERVGRRRSLSGFVLAWGAAAAVVVAAVIVGRALLGSPGGPVGRTLSGPPSERDKVRPTLERAEAVPASQPNEPAAIQPARIPARQFTRRLATAIPPPPDEEESPIPPIAIEPLATVPLRTVALEAVQIAVDQSSGVMPIEIAPLRIEPLQGQ